MLSIKKILFFLFLLPLSLASSQTNDSDASLYKWKGKKTTPSPGYVVLKSGKKVDGIISLKGSQNNLTGLTIVTNGREIDLPMGSLSSFGLNSNKNTASSNSSKLKKGVVLKDDPSFIWGPGATVMGKFQQTTKKRVGYIILPDGSRLDGSLTLKKVDDTFSQLTIKTSSKKYKFAPSEVSDYGAAFTISDITKNGKKTYKDAGRNFFPGKIIFNNNTEKNGIIAFSKKSLINPNKPNRGLKYNGVYYTPDEESIISVFNNRDVYQVIREENGVKTTYQYYNGAFIDQNTFDRSFKDPTRQFNKGVLTLIDGTSLTGQILQEKSGGTFYGKKVIFKDNAGQLTNYLPKDVLSFSQIIEGETRNFIVEQGTFVELEFDGDVFSYYRNPFSTTTNKFLTGLASTGINVATSTAASALSEKNGIDGVDSIIQNASEEDLQVMQDELTALSEKDNLTKEQEEYVARYQGAIASRQVGLATNNAINEGGGIKKKEWIIYNKKTNEKITLVKSKYKKQIEPLLKGCFEYLTMEKSEQKKLNNFDNIFKMLTQMDSCY